jgi:formylglycine-generating enzyme required for sulfatase activity
MILIYSAQVNQSYQIIRELELAVDGGLAILPFRIEEAPPSGAVEFYIGSCHWLDALTEPVEQHLEKLCRSVRANLDALGPQPGAAQRRRRPPFVPWPDQHRAGPARSPDTDAARNGYTAAVHARSVAHQLRKRLDHIGDRIEQRSNRAGSRKEAELLKQVRAFHDQTLANPELFAIDVSIESGETMLRDRLWHEALPVLTEAAAGIERLIQRVEAEEPRLRARVRADEVRTFFQTKLVDDSGPWDVACSTLETAEADLSKGDHAGARAGFERATELYSAALNALASAAAQKTTRQAASVAEYLANQSFSRNDAYLEATRKLESGQRQLEQGDPENALTEFEAAQQTLDGILTTCAAALEAMDRATAREQKAVEYCTRGGLPARRVHQSGLRELESGKSALQQGNFPRALTCFRTAYSEFDNAIEETRTLLGHKRSCDQQAKMAQARRAELDSLLQAEGLVPDEQYSRASAELDAADERLREEDFRSAILKFSGAAAMFERALLAARQLVETRDGALAAQLEAETRRNEARARAQELADLRHGRRETGSHDGDASNAFASAIERFQEGDYAGALNGFVAAAAAFDDLRRDTERSLAAARTVRETSERVLAKKEEIGRLIAEGGVSVRVELSAAVDRLKSAQARVRSGDFVEALRQFNAAEEALTGVLGIVQSLLAEKTILRQRLADAEAKAHLALEEYCKNRQLSEEEVTDQRRALLDAASLAARGQLAEAVAAFTNLFALIERDSGRGCRAPFGWEVTDAAPVSGWAAQVRDPSTGIEFRFVPSGSFLMGSPAGAASDTAGWDRSDERPQHDVRLSKPFYLAVTTTTRAQWMQGIGERAGSAARLITPGGDPSSPVTQLTWQQARDFCRRLGYRLPTEAEWEYACRAEERTSSQELSSIAWHSESNRQIPYPVGQKAPNPWGLHDMLGNVWEWCADTYNANAYSASPRVDPVDTRYSPFKIVRGGSWCSPPGTVRPACRRRVTGDVSATDIGFRCVRDV